MEGKLSFCASPAELAHQSLDRDDFSLINREDLALGYELEGDRLSRNTMKNSLDRSYKYHGRFLGWGSSPDADWRIMFSVFLLLLIILATLCTLLYRDIRKEQGAVEESGEPVNAAALRRISSFYEKQKLEFESAKTVPEITPDPSL